MRRPSAFAVLILVVAACAAFPGSGRAAWTSDPNVNLPVCVAAANQTGVVGASDGAGGAFIAWGDARTDAGDIYVQRVLANGTIAPGWPANGLAVCTAASTQFGVQIAADGSGGAYVAWTDTRNASAFHVYVTRVLANGTIAPGWPANGASSMVITAKNEGSPHIASDGLGGLYATQQLAFGAGDDDLYLVRWNGNGTVAAGFPATVSSAGFEQLNASLAVDPGSHAAAVAYQDNLASGGSDFDVHVKGISSTGTTLFDLNATSAADQSNARIASDGFGGWLVAWTDATYSPTAILAKRMTATGSAVWGANFALATGGSLDALAIYSDNAHGAYVLARPSGVFSDGMIATRMTSGGGFAPGWSVTGTTIINGFLSGYTSAPDQQGGLLTQVAGRPSGLPEVNRLLPNGTSAPGWIGLPNGLATTTAYAPQTHAIVPDGQGGAIFAWADFRNGTDDDVYAQHVDRYGTLGTPEPSIVSVKDVPFDQGGNVRVSWNASQQDVGPYPNVSSYRLWRQVPAAGALAALATGRAVLSNDEGSATPPSDASGSAAAGRRTIKTTTSATQTIYWELAATQVAAQKAGYSIAAATLGDSVAAGNPRTLFMVEALGFSSQLWDSPPDSGYSVDNLPPAVPAPFAGAYNSSLTHLSWNRNAEHDLAGYRLYRGPSAGFVPSPVTLLAEQPDTGYVATPGGYYYKLTAVDVHGNESPASLVSPPDGTVSATDPTPRALAFALASANPSRGPATFRLSLPHAARVSVAIYDAGGRRVRTIVSGTLEAGERSLAWDGRDAGGNETSGGLYFARTDVEGRTFGARIVRLR